MVNHTKPVVLDARNAQPHEVMQFLIGAISEMGSNLLQQAALAEVSRTSTAAYDDAFEAMRAEVDALAHQFDEALDAITTEDTMLGTAVLAVLQVGVVAMSKYIEMAERVDELSTVTGVTDPHALGKMVTEEAQEENGLNVERGVMLRRKTRDDH